MSRRFVILVITLLLVPPATARGERAIQWLQKVEDGMALAQQTKRPLMFWVLGRSDRRDRRMERSQKQAFRDPLVVEMSSRFVPVKLATSRHPELLEDWNLSPRINLEIVFATPAGKKIDTLAPLGVAQPDALARKMVLVFRHYRRQLFEHGIRPKLEDAETSDEDLQAALKLVAEFLILSADQSLVNLLERQSLSPSVRNQAYDALAALSTSTSVEALLSHAIDDEHAADVLVRCTPAAAEQMLPALEGPDPALRLVVYRAVTRICGIRNVKSDRFWQGRVQSVQRHELERVRRLVTATAQRWRKRYAEYR